MPPLIVRRASTTVELRDGQSFVIGGLLQSDGQNAISQLPWLGDVPVLGALFRSTSYQKNETDLAIIVTPRLVRPARPGDVIKTPLDTSLPANDVDLFLMGKTEVPPAKARLIAGVPPREFTGHVLDLPKGGAHVRLGPQLRRSPPRRCWARRSAAARTSTSTAATRSRCVSGDAMATNRVTQTIDPWPPASGKRNIAYNGEKAATASERYRTGRVIPPVNATTSSAGLCAGAAAGAVDASNPGFVGAERQQRSSSSERRRTRVLPNANDSSRRARRTRPAWRC